MTNFHENSSKNLHVLAVMNSFKESMSSEQANEAVLEGIRDCAFEFDFQSAVFADGGQGTLEALKAQRDVQNRTCLVRDAMLSEKNALYTVDPQEGVVYMEMAQAAPLTDVSRLSPLTATTFGVGEMIADALDQGYRHFVIGIGGSATSDGGKGMLEALGFEFLDKHGNPAAHGNAGLADVQMVSSSRIHPALEESTFEIACDVENPLLGPSGCIAVFGPQKGVTSKMYDQAEAAMTNWKEVSQNWHHQVYPNADSANLHLIPGAGAAGGLGFAFVTYLNGTLKSGADLVIEKNSIEEKIQWADIVITGEGSFDSQSLDGKGPGTIISLAKHYGKKALVFAGCVDLTPEASLKSGVDGFFSIMQCPCALKDALPAQAAMSNLRKSVFEVFLLIKSLWN